jgi:hypothetical protein
MAKIAAQALTSYGSNNREVALEIVAIVSVDGSVIDQQNLHGASIGSDGFVKPPDEFRGGGPIVPKRHKDDKA